MNARERCSHSVLFINELSIIVQVCFLLCLHFEDCVHVVFMTQFRCISPQRDHALVTKHTQLSSSQKKKKKDFAQTNFPNEGA